MYGFEILPAPFVISHLQIGMLLHRLGAPFADDSDERAGVHLTNALTGWETPTEPKQRLLFPEMEEERDKAQAVKQHAPILVILGNPPYNAYAGVSPDEEAGLVEPYKKGLISEWGIKKSNLDELFVRFFGLAERRIGQVSKRGLVSFISSASWLSDPSFVVLRKHLLESFDAFWIEDLHGNRKSSEYASDGRTSETISAMAGQSAGIQQGVATSLWCRTGRDGRTCRVLYRDDIDDAKASDRRARLLGSVASADLATVYLEVVPAAETHLAFRPVTTAPEYQSWPSVAELTCEPPSLGLLEKRGGAMIDMERAALVDRMGLYFDGTRTLEDLPESLQGLKSHGRGSTPPRQGTRSCPSRPSKRPR